MAYNSMIKKVQEYAKKMIEYCYLQLSAYRTNNILIPYGDDFSHTNATETYTFFNELKTQIDLIQKYAHSEDNPETVFDKYQFSFELSTMEKYLDSVFEDSKKAKI